ncbi:MAG: hypothetical protein RLP09_30090 [Sandaracinaceae bacterium]
MHEVIPDEHHVVRYLTGGEVEVRGQTVVLSLNATLYEPDMSVDWHERTTLADGYERQPRSAAHAIWNAGRLREVGENVLHKPLEANPAHCEVCTPDGQKRSKQQKYTLAQIATQISVKPSAE